ncbi:TfuA-like protein [Acinetobacter venetianus]|uniref:TfuA-like protein n=1 Tax=Acinetobacter venetianus TaxID=52133 RepID=A0A150HXK7_9GAMM|nr:TfuA-like protein [Acinetobacter venetianus]KXZ71491.1 TfuA-like protein [Acinetobacter venetianus]
MGKITIKEAVVAFIGPSSFGTNLLETPQGINYLPPVKRDDITKLLDSGFIGDVLIVDGYFHSQPSVSHSEIVNAIQAGCNVWGVSSMGAIRAYEMKENGMKGFGYVYNCFIHYDDFTDDEVALMHLPVPPYNPVSEPLVNIRYFLDSLVKNKYIDQKICSSIIEKFKCMYFGDRYLSDMFKMLSDHVPQELLIDYQDNFDQFRVKTIDLMDFFKMKVWENYETYNGSVNIEGVPSVAQV